DHCFGMCKDVERLIDQSFGNNKLDYTINVDLMRQKLARDLANPNNTSEINFIISDIIGDPVVRYSEIQTKLMNSLHAENINDLRAQISLGARLHNIGKICVPLSLIDGKMKPSDSQFDQIAVHVKKGEQILKKFGFPKEIVVMALYHHTRKDVYRKLLGLDDGTNNESIIPIQTKLIEIIDVYNALTTPRSYRPSVHSRLSALNITKSMIGNDQEYKELFKLFVKYLLN
ncbi:MAG: HD domain-containing protein, partial [Candidatus Falkowbacteria bacterium]|nr:HD domain-containing protein [Candidatus Falkowbacteria bacterium]